MSNPFYLFHNTMPYCANCGDEVDPSNRYCTSCGAEIEIESGIEDPQELDQEDSQEGMDSNAHEPEMENLEKGMGYPTPEMGTENFVTGRRIAAVIIDSLAISIILALLPVRGEAFFAILLPVYFAYFLIMEGIWGQTVGKKVLGIVVVKDDGTPITMGESFIRNVLRFVDGFLSYLVGFLAMTVSDKNQRIGDRMAGTVVVKTQ